MTQKYKTIDDWDKIEDYTVEAFTEMNERRKNDGWKLIDATEEEEDGQTVRFYHWQKSVIDTPQRHDEMMSELSKLLGPLQQGSSGGSGRRRPPKPLKKSTPTDCSTDYPDEDAETDEL